MAQRCKSSEFFSTLDWGAAIDIRSAIHRLGHPVLGLACPIYLKFSVLWLTVLWRRSSGNSLIQPLFCESWFRCIWQLSCPFLRRASIKASSTNLSRSSSPHSPTTTTSLNCFVTSHSRICHIPVLLMPSATSSAFMWRVCPSGAARMVPSMPKGETSGRRCSESSTTTCRC